MRKPELLAPAGSMSMLRAAVDAGADAVYLGLNQYNARIHATNFTLENLSEALEFAHLRNTRVFVTLNTLVDDDEIIDAVELAMSAYEKGVDAFLVQDIGLASYLAEHLPQIPVHASTQMNVFSMKQLQEMRDFKISRVVLPRELSLDEIRSRAALWHSDDVEVEVFVHGAMCVCYSGLCLFSSMNKSGSRSGNRGACAQPCRQSYQIFDGNREIETYGKPLQSGKLLSPKDQSALPYLRELMEAGVDSLKIEGRMRDENYCTAVVSAYRRMINAIAEDRDTQEVMDQVKNDLLVTFNRGGDFTTQYLQGKKGPDYLSGEYAGKYGLYWGEVLSVNPKLGTINVRSWQQDVPEKGDFLSIREKENEVASFPIGKIEVSRNSALVKGLHPDAITKLKQGMSVYRMSKHITVSKEQVRRTPVSGVLSKNDDKIVLTLKVAEGLFSGVTAEHAVNVQDLGDGEPLSWERTIDQLNKTGQTPFRLSGLEMEGDFPISLRISSVNELRRCAMGKMAEAILDASLENRSSAFAEEGETKEIGRTAPEKKHIVIADYIDMDRITDGYACGADLYAFSVLSVLKSGRIGWIDELLSEEPGAKIALRLPGAYKDEMQPSIEKASDLLMTHAGKRFTGFFGTFADEETIGLLAGTNIYNHFSYEYSLKQDVEYILPSYELTNEQIVRMAQLTGPDKKTAYLGVHRYGPVEWMQSEFCPLGRHQKNCSLCREHPEVSLGEKITEKGAMHNDSRVDVVCYPGFCRSDLFGTCKNMISAKTVQSLLNQQVPVASVARFMNEDQMERRSIVDSLLDIGGDDEEFYEEGEDWYEY